MTESDPAPAAQEPSGRDQFHDWVVIGTQSVGGGASTLYLMRAILVNRRKWLSLRDFFQDWTLSRLSVGNHLTALAALIGHRIGGHKGVVLAVTGLLIPSGIITALLTGGFSLIRDQPAIQSALAGIAPVTIGMMLGISYVLVRTILSPRWLPLMVDLVVFAAAAVVGFVVAASTIAIIVTGAVIGTLFLGRDEVPPETLQP